MCKYKLESYYWRLNGWCTDQIFKNKRLPYYSKWLKYWGVPTVDGVEKGPLEWVLGEWLGTGMIYRYHTAFMDDYHYHDHDHDFERVIGSVAVDPLNFSYHDFEEDYSTQQLATLDRVQKQYTVSPDPKRWTGFELPETVSGANIEDETMSRVDLQRDYAQIFRAMRPPFRIYHHDHILMIPDPLETKNRWDKKLTIFGQKLTIPGDFVLCLHCEDPTAETKVISQLTDEEYTLLSQNVLWGDQPIDQFNQTTAWVPHYHLDYFEVPDLIYRYHTTWLTDNPHAEHADTFEQVLEVLVHDPKHFAIDGYEADYNAQERAFLDAVKQRYLIPRAKDRWQGFAFPEEVPGASLELFDNSLGRMAASRDFYVGMRHLQAPFNYYRHDNLLIIPDPVPDAMREQGKKVVAFGMEIEVPGTFVMFMHVDDWDTKPIVVSEMSEEEYASIEANLTVNGVGNLQSPPPRPMFLDEIKRQAEENKPDD